MLLGERRQNAFQACSFTTRTLSTLESTTASGRNQIIAHAVSRCPTETPSRVNSATAATEEGRDRDLCQIVQRLPASCGDFVAVLRLRSAATRRRRPWREPARPEPGRAQQHAASFKPPNTAAPATVAGWSDLGDRSAYTIKAPTMTNEAATASIRLKSGRFDTGQRKMRAKAGG